MAQDLLGGNAAQAFNDEALRGDPLLAFSIEEILAGGGSVVAVT